MKGSQLKKLIQDTGKSQAFVSQQIGTSTAMISLLINRGQWPRSNTKAFKDTLRTFLNEHGAKNADINAAFAQLDACGCNDKIKNQEEFLMIRKHVLTPQAKCKFRIAREIFDDNISEVEDVFLSPETRYVSESIYQLAKHGGWMALVGESGSGKTTLFSAEEDRLDREGFKIRIITPYVLGMDNGNKKAVPMKPTHVCEAILQSLNVEYKGNLSSEALFKLTHDKLIDSADAGYKHLLVFEDAHSLPKPMFKALKRMFELKKGMARLLAILLLAQPELKDKLSEDSKEVREAVQRMELVELGALDDLEGYVRHRCQRVGASFDAIFAPDALPELALLLVGTRDKKGRGKSRLFPLLVGNALTKAINNTENLKMPLVTAANIQAAIQKA